MAYLMDKIGAWSQNDVLVATMITLVAVWLALLARSKALRGRLPPGPRGWPIVGSLLSLGNEPHITWEKLSKIYGPIMLMRLGLEPVVIISSPEMAEEVLKTKDSVTATRPPKPIAFEAMWDKEDLAFAKLGPTWRTMRRLCSTELLTARRLQSAAFQNIRRTEILGTVLGVLNESQRNEGKQVNITQLIQRQTFNNITRMVMGRRFYSTETASQDTQSGVESLDAAGVEIFQKFFELLGAPNISDYIPFLRPFDLQGFEKKGKALSKRLEKYLHAIVDECEKNLPSAETQDSATKGTFAEQLVKLQPENIPEKERIPHNEYLSKDEMKGIILDMISAGSDTSSTMLEWSLAELTKHPHMMKRAQAELEKVVGRERFVEEADIPKLSYLQAVVKEALRLHPAVPHLQTHCAVEECELGGYRIPAKTQIHINAWAIHRDPAVWERPLEFDPDRFLHSNIEVSGQCFKYIPFGSGRRFCPGYNLGMIMVQYPLAQLLHVFDWGLPDGQKLEEFDLSAAGALVYRKAEPLILVPKLRLPAHVIQQLAT